MTPTTLAPIAPNVTISQVRYDSLTDCQRMIARLRDLLEPGYSLTPINVAGGWHIRYTERP